MKIIFLALFLIVSNLVFSAQAKIQKKMPKMSEMIWVSKSDGGKSCEKDSGTALEAGVHELKKSGIDIYGAEKGSDGKVRAQMCGIPSGTQNRFLILKKNISKLPLGYLPIAQKR